MLDEPIEVLESLLKQYQNAGVSANLILKESEETVGETPAIKVDGKRFDLVQAKDVGGMVGSSESVEGSHKKITTRPVLRFDYIIKGMGGKREEEIRTELKAKKKGFIKKKLLDVSWDGALSKELNSDTELKKGLLTLGIDNLKIEPDGKNDCIRIMHEKKIAVIEDLGGGSDPSKIVESWDEVEKRVEDLPSMKIFETIDTIAGYVKSI